MVKKASSPPLLPVSLRPSLRVALTPRLDDVAGDAAVDGGVALVQNDEEEVETRHQRRSQTDVRLQTLAAVVASADGVGRRQDRRARVQRGRDARLGDRDRLLLHGLWDIHMICWILHE